jgi:hypothetical protein
MHSNGKKAILTNNLYFNIFDINTFGSLRKAVEKRYGDERRNL